MRHLISDSEFDFSHNAIDYELEIEFGAAEVS